MLTLVIAAASLASEVLAMVNGKPITRAQLEAALSDAARQGYHDAVADLKDFEHATGAAVVGPASAPVRIVIFTDFECPYCRESELTLSHIREQYGDRVALYYLNYPLPTHPYAQPAAVAAACAAAQAKYAVYHDALFAHQLDLAHADYAAWAQAAGLDCAVFET